MKFKAFICLVALFLFTACDNTNREEEEELLRLEDTYHLEKVEFFLSDNDGLTVDEIPGMRRGAYINEGNIEIGIGFKDEDTFTSIFYFADDQTYTLVLDPEQKIRVPALLENNILYIGMDDLWLFQNNKEEEQLTGGLHAYNWTIAPKHQTIVERTITTSTIRASFHAYFIGENTQSELIIPGKWEGRKRKYSNYIFDTYEIEK